MKRVLHIIEPTLESEAGHCFSFVESLCSARSYADFELSIWVDRRAKLGSIEEYGASIHPYFFRRIRRIQELFLLRKLLLRPGRIFISTSGRTDLILLDLAAGVNIPPKKVFMYFHWLRLSQSKASLFRKIARRHPHIEVLGPTETVVRDLRDCGFSRAFVVPYPISSRRAALPSDEFFSLLYAGAARKDKGFGLIVDLVEMLSSSHDQIPIKVQTSPDHYRRHDKQTKEDLERLRRIGYPWLEEFPETLSENVYGGIFKGAICLQPYDREDFIDRISGVTLDSLSMGCPVVVPSGTWMAHTVRRFEAGIVVDDLAARSLMEAVEVIRVNYSLFSRRATEAGTVLHKELSSDHLLEHLTADEPSGG
ncbi:MAG: hypothetical protein ACC669_08510 [bacterium]